MTVYKDLPALIGFCREGTFSHLVDKSLKNGCNFCVVDLNRIESCTHLSIENDFDCFKVRIDDDVFILGNKPIFYRGFYRPFSSESRSNLLRKFLLKIETNIQLLPKDCLVFNRPLAGISNASKPLHIAELQSCGFTIPNTFYSTCGKKVSSTIAPNNKWINKGVSGVRTIVESVGGEEISRLNNLKNCPSLFQIKVVGYDVRVHMIQAESVALKIESTKLDYRYAKRQGGKIKISPTSIPTVEKYKAIEYMSRSGLCFSGFDFKVDRDGSWWLLEANPMPGFEFFDHYTDDAIASVLLEQMESNIRLSGKPKFDTNSIFITGDRIPSVDLGV